jgi:hypothetical protein
MRCEWEPVTSHGENTREHSRSHHEREHGRDYDRERRHDRSHEDDGWRRRRAWESDRNQAARESRPDWGEGAHEDERASAAERLSAGHGREWRQGEGSRERPRSEDREPGRRDQDSGHGYGRERPAIATGHPSRTGHARRAPRGAHREPPATRMIAAARSAPGAPGNWGSSPTRSGSFVRAGRSGLPRRWTHDRSARRAVAAAANGPASSAVEAARAGEDPRTVRRAALMPGADPKGIGAPTSESEEEINERTRASPRDRRHGDPGHRAERRGHPSPAASRTGAAKRLAEDLVDDVYGVKDVQNQLRTSTHPRRSESPANDPGGSDPGAHPSSTLHGSSGEARRGPCRRAGAEARLREARREHRLKEPRRPARRGASVRRFAGELAARTQGMTCWAKLKQEPPSTPMRPVISPGRSNTKRSSMSRSPGLVGHEAKDHAIARHLQSPQNRRDLLQDDRLGCSGDSSHTSTRRSPGFATVSRRKDSLP